MVSRQVPTWAQGYLKHEAFAEVGAAVKNSERKTSGEIVPMIVRRSVKSVPRFYPAWALRLFASAADLDGQVHYRAFEEFHKAGLTNTAGRTGILIFLSLEERRVVVLADQAIAAKLPPETWHGVVATITDSIRQGQLVRGLCDAISDCAELLAPHFPRAMDDVNELKDSLILAE